MGSKILEFIIRAKDSTKAGLSKVRQNFQGLAGKVGGSIKSMMGSMARIIGVTAGVAGALKLFTSSIKSAFEFERYEVQFKVLFGSLEKAKQHIAELKNFSASTPLEFGDIAQASRTLIVMTNGVMGAKESLELVGDAATATGANIGELATWVGRAYGAIKSGRPFGEAAQRLMELGIITPDVRAEMEKLQAEGATNAEVWAKLQESMEKYKGGMEELSTTGEGLFSTMKDNWNLTLAEFGKSFEDIAKNEIKLLIKMMEELKENGSIEVWADQVKTSLEDLAITIQTVSKGLKFAYKWSGAKLTVDTAMTVNKAQIAAIKGAMAGAGALTTGMGLKDAWGVAKTTAKESYTGERASKIRAAAKEENAQAAKKAEDEKITEEQARTKDLKLAQAQKDEKTAAKLAEEAKKAQEKADKELADQRAKDMRALVEEEKNLKRAAISQLGDEQSKQQDRLSRAEQAASQAWAEYKDPELRKQRKEAEAQDKAMRDQFAKDKERVGFKVAAGMQLTDQEQAAQRVMNAEKEKEAAQKALGEIAENTAATRKLLEELMRMK